MISSLIFYLLVGAGVGAVVGYIGKCSSGTCPLTSTWWRGAIYGAALGGALYWLSDRRGSESMHKSTPNVQRIGADQFDATVTHSAKPVVVDFYATWCAPCKRLSPLLDKLAGPFTNEIKFVKVDVDQAPAIASRFQIEGIPTIVFFKDGKVVDSIVGLPTADELKSRLESLAGPPALSHGSPRLGPGKRGATLSLSPRRGEGRGEG